MTSMRRRARIALWTTTAVAIAASAAVVLRLEWPDANQLAGTAARGDVAGVRLGLRLGIDPNEPSTSGWDHAPGPTPLTAAARFGRVDVVRLLLDEGADPDLRDGGAESPHATPLATAAMHGQLEVCRVLLEAGADPNLPTYPGQPGDPGDWTALDWALEAEETAVADLLRRHGAVEGARRGGG